MTAFDDIDDEPYVVRFTALETHPDHHRVIRSGLTLEEAQAHCRDPRTCGDGWFDGYQIGTPYEEPSEPIRDPLPDDLTDSTGEDHVR
jgi:hypothetical protein